jgi:hypothetical protein
MGILTRAVGRKYLKVKRLKLKRHRLTLTAGNPK